MFRRFAIIVGILVSPHVASAQQRLASIQSIDATNGVATAPLSRCDSSGTYIECALRNERFVIRQGADGRIVSGHRSFLHRVALVPLVSGDSATAYARAFERQDLRSRQFGVGVAASLLASSVFLMARCRSACARSSHETYGIVLPLVGLGFMIPEKAYAGRALESLSNALWWNNARFVR